MVQFGAMIARCAGYGAESERFSSGRRRVAGVVRVAEWRGSVRCGIVSSLRGGTDMRLTITLLLTAAIIAPAAAQVQPDVQPLDAEDEIIRKNPELPINKQPEIQLHHMNDRIDRGILPNDMEWFTVISPDGKVEGIHAIIPGSEAEFLRSLEPGTTVTKTDSQPFMAQFLPSAEDVAATVANALESARLGVCGMGAGRPKQFTATVNIGLETWLKGSIEMTADWDTEQMCEDQ